MSNRKKTRVHRSAAQRRLTALALVDTQLTPPSLSQLSEQQFSLESRLSFGLCWPLSGSFAGSTQERASFRPQHHYHYVHHTAQPCAMCASM